MIIRNTAALFALRNGLHLGRFAVVAVFLLSFFVSGAWGACYTSELKYGGCSSSNNSDWCSSSGCTTIYPNKCRELFIDCRFTTCNGHFTDLSISYPSSGGCSLDSYRAVCCTSTQELDSIVCVNAGNVWQNGQCQDPIDSTACDSYRQECESFGGRFTGNVVSSDVSETGCLSFCDMCTSEGQELYRKSRAMVCCRKGMAPPASVTSCQNLELSGSPDMSFSSFDCDNRGGYDCECEDINSDNASTYNSICNNNEWPDDTTGSGGGSDESSSSEEGSPSDTSGDWEYDYRDSLHRIIKYDSINMENTSAILSCLLSPVSCDGLNSGGDSVVVNVPSDSVILKSIATKLDGLNSTLDTSVQNSSERLGDNITRSISASTDSLIDSMRKYMGAYHGDIQEMDSANRAYLSDIHSVLSQIQRDSSGAGRIVGKLDSALGSGSGADTSGVSYNWLQHGEALGDSIVNGSGYGGLDFGADSLLRDSLLNAGYSCNNDSCCIGSQCVYFDSDSLIEDSLTRYISRMGDSINQKNASYLNDSTTALFSEVHDSLKAFNPLGIFDSTMLNTLGAKIPNTNTCPEHCSRFQVDIPFFFGTRSYTIDFGLCLGRSVFADGNVLSFLRFIIRLIVAITCITAVMWNAARIRR